MSSLITISYDVSLLLQTAKCIIGSKPCLVFSGDLFETDSEYARLMKNIFISENEYSIDVGVSHI